MKRGMCKAVVLVLVILVQVSESLEEFELEWGWLGSIVNDESRIVSPFSHVQGTKVERTLLTATLLEDN